MGDPPHRRSAWSKPECSWGMAAGSWGRMVKTVGLKSHGLTAKSGTKSGRTLPEISNAKH